MTIQRVVYTSHDLFTADSAITRFLRAKRFAHQQLQALARIHGHHADSTPVVVFLSAHDDGCSPMAQGFFQHFAEDRAVAWSGGSEPVNEINPTAVAAMHERGIDITSEFPKPWTHEIIHAADTVVTIGSRNAYPVFSDKPHLHWDINEPAGLSLHAIRATRDKIEQRVRELSEELQTRPG